MGSIARGSQYPSSSTHRNMCGCLCTSNVKILVVSLVLFSTITAAQWMAAIISNSNALMVDCYSMLVDTIGYAGNLYAEGMPSQSGARERSQLIAAGVSLAILYVPSTVYGLQALQAVSVEPLGSGFYCQNIPLDQRRTGHMACGNATHARPEVCLEHTPHWGTCKHSREPDVEPVSPWIVFGFAAFGLAFDMFSLLAFYHWGEPPLEVLDEAEAEVEMAARQQPSLPASPRDPTLEDAPEPSHLQSRDTIVKDRQRSERMNMLSAFLHVGADTLRSSTTMLESLLIIYGHADGERADAWATLFIAATICIGAFGALNVWLRHVYKYMKRPKRALEFDTLEEELVV